MTGILLVRKRMVDPMKKFPGHMKENLLVFSGDGKQMACTKQRMKSIKTQILQTIQEERVD